MDQPIQSGLHQDDYLISAIKAIPHSRKAKPVQDLAARDKQVAMIDDLEPALASYYTIGGTLYSRPFNSSAPEMFFDSTAFKAVGLDVNKRIWTYDELLAAAKKLTGKAAITFNSIAGLRGYAANAEKPARAWMSAWPIFPGRPEPRVA